MSTPTPFHHYRDRGQLLEVAMDDVKVLLPGSNQLAIGTQGLNGCTCVVIFGTTAMLLAHISPLPGTSANWEQASLEDRHRASYSHHQRYLQIITQMVQQHGRHFPASATSWGIFAVDSSYKVLQAVVTQIETHLNAIGLGMEKAFYNEIDRRLVRPPKGELIGVRKSGGFELYLERTKLWPKPTSSSSARPSSQSSSSSASTSRRTTNPNAGPGQTTREHRTVASSSRGPALAPHAEMQAACLTSLELLGLTRAVARVELQRHIDYHVQQGQISDPSNVLLRATYDLVREKGVSEQRGRNLIQRLQQAGSASDVHNADEDTDEDDEE